MKRRDIGLVLSVRPSVFEGGCFVDITSPSMEVPRCFLRSFSLQPRIVDVQRQGFSLIGKNCLIYSPLNLGKIRVSLSLRVCVLWTSHLHQWKCLEIFFRSFSFQPRIVDVRRQGFSLIGKNCLIYSPLNLGEIHFFLKLYLVPYERKLFVNGSGYKFLPFT